MTRDIIDCIATELELQVNRDEVRAIEEQLVGGDYEDFYAVIDGEEYRFIHEDFIWNIYVDDVKETTIECYLCEVDRSKLWWLAIDWEQTAENVFSSDGYGNTFATYDGNEYEYMFDDANYFIFRIN